MTQISRRKLLRGGAQAIAAGSAALAAGPGLVPRAFSKETFAGVDYYQKLGVTPFINAAGTYTVLSASTMPEEVQAAIALAAKKSVNLNELLDASGAYLAKQLRCEAALVTSGAAAALVVGTAACVTMGNDQAIPGIPTLGAPRRRRRRTRSWTGRGAGSRSRASRAPPRGPGADPGS